MKKKNALIVALGALVLSTLSFSVVTFAWLNYQEKISLVNIKSGELVIGTVATDVYKYTYPFIEGTTVIDYSSSGSVVKKTLSDSDKSVEMNLFDPTLLKINPTLSIKDLNTNVIVKVTLPLTYSTAVDASLWAQEIAYTGTDLRASDYLHFTALTQETFTSLCDVAGYTNPTDEQTFNLIKTYCEATTTTDGVTTYNHPYSSIANAGTGTYSTDSKAQLLGTSASNYYTPLISSRPSSEAKNQDVTFYINVDYDDALTKGTNNVGYSLYSEAKIGSSFTMAMDYHFIISLRQA